ncbi:hypothetical protein ACFL6S_10205 [Candidatus Poribacteria bacterium]
MIAKEINGEQFIDEHVQSHKDIGEIADRLSNAFVAVLGNIDFARIYLGNGEPKRRALKSLSDAEAFFPEIMELIQSLSNLSDEVPQ